MFTKTRPVFLALLFAAFPFLATGAESPFSFESTPGQLPKTVYPSHYQIRLQPDLGNFTTHGSLTVEIEVLKPINELVLNALDMDVTNATLAEGQKITPLRPRLNAAKQTLVFPLSEELHPGRYLLALEFSGKIGDQAQGLYWVRYAAGSGKKIMLGTQMEPADARRMFPCWDEPVFRATYDLTVIVPEKHLPISNMPIERETHLDRGLKEVKFLRTPPMASYLVVFVSGELEELKGEAEGVKIRVLTTEGKRDQARYALESTKKVLAYYNRYFGVRYPLPKLDQIAVPGGFSGAMENWGAITYNERNLLFDPATSSQATRQAIFSVLAHEMAHQWFGDLVTTAWWNDLWLNEGFASWMATKVTDALNPEWEISLAAGSVKSGVMNDDSRSATHPILQTINNESEANDAFDHITYQKGQSFLRMLENFLGEQPFRNGIRQYMADHKYSSATTADLWAALEKSSGKPVAALAAAWTEQPGLPIVKVSTNCVNGRQIVTLEQERFTVQDPDAQPLLWTIPVELRNLHGGKLAFAMLSGKSTSVPFGDCGDIIKANAGDAGYYRVTYEPALGHKLRTQVAKLPDADQLNLLNDAWAMVEADRAPISGYLDLAKALKDSRTLAIWSQMLTAIESIDGLADGSDVRTPYREFAFKLLRPQLVRLRWDPRIGDSPNDLLLRSRLITILGNFGDQAVINEARARFNKFLAKPSSLSADLRAPVLTIVGRNADRPTYDKLHELARNAKGTEERQLYYRAMAAAADPELARATLALSLSGETIPQETAYFPAQVATIGNHPDLAWDFAREHMKDLLAQIESFRRNAYFPGIMGAFSDNAHADELETYVKETVGEGAVKKARETAQAIRLKAALKQRELPRLDRWLAAQPLIPPLAR